MAAAQIRRFCMPANQAEFPLFPLCRVPGWPASPAQPRLTSPGNSASGRSPPAAPNRPCSQRPRPPPRNGHGRPHSQLAPRASPATPVIQPGTLLTRRLVLRPVRLSGQRDGKFSLVMVRLAGVCSPVPGRWRRSRKRRRPRRDRDQPGMRPGYPPVLHRPDIAAPHRRPIQEAGPDRQAAYHNEVIAMTAERGPVRARSGWTLTALRRAVGVLRYLQQENMRASEAICRPIGAPRPRPRADAPAGSAGPAASTAERAERVG
jgi:hypothetical protein